MLLSKTLILIFACLTLAACDEGYHVVDTSSPDINYFEVVDSYGNSNLQQDSHGYGGYRQNLVIDPLFDNGYFELWWDVSSYSDYIATLYINDGPGIYGSYELDRTRCANGLSCDYEGFAYCFYERLEGPHTDTLSCSTSQYTNTAYDITSILSGHPSDVYMILEVCDGANGYCDIQSQKLLFK
jgi:hypothetical protein